MENLGQDAEAVAAVRQGDAERYRELVERHERLVYAVAWSRLGDAALAEEAAQEAFIRGYRRLWLLGNGAKFSAWIAAITRHAAVNLGLRHRRELDKRERWALEQSTSEEGDSPELCPPETLRKTLAELPEASRECLVLFYLEGKRGAEAAAALGISEAALRVRLHRARALLRERLEARLADSLEQLRPSRALVPLIMAALPASSAGKTAVGLGGTFFGALSKFAPLKFSLFLSVAPLLPGLLMNWVIVRMESQNFRDREGFRARLFRESSRWWILWIALILVGSSALARIGHRFVSFETFFLGISACAFAMSSIVIRRLAVIRNRFFVGLVVMTVCLACVTLAVGLNRIPFQWIAYFAAAQMIGMTFFLGDRPLRTDYNLFLRAAEGLLPATTVILSYDSMTVGRAPRKPNGRAELFKFARFLGARWLVNNFRQTKDGLVLSLVPVKFASFNMLWWIWSRSSELTLHRDGTVTAFLHPNDRKILQRMRPEHLWSDKELETLVTGAVTSAWRKFQAGDFAAAESALGQVSEDQMFLRPQKKSMSTRVQRVMMIAIAAVLVIQMVAMDRLMNVSLRDIENDATTSRKQEKKLALSELAHAKNEQERFDKLGLAAKECFMAGQIVEARKYATELMTLLPKYKGQRSEGDEIQDANLILGRIAVREGKIDAAKKYLIQAGKTPGSPSLDSFGPNMSLAQDLLEKGQKDTVLEYFNLCGKFWTTHQEKLNEWRQEVLDGKTPDFGANLVY